MNRLLTAVAIAAALCTGGAAHAGVLNFNNPAAIDIDINGVATYHEAGFTITGPAASFLTLGDALVGGLDTTPFHLMAEGGGDFGLQGLEFNFFDLGFGDPPGMLSVIGLLNGVQVASATLDLGSPGTRQFGAAWAHLTDVRFSANGGFTLDNIAAVPEPGTLALTASGLLMSAGFMAFKRRRSA